MPVESDGRPVRERATARVVLLDPDNRVLLINERDPESSGELTYWLTPGGGIDPGESAREAASRELSEEVGLDLRPEALRGPIARRTVVHAYSDKIMIQPETFFVAQVAPFDVTPNGLTPEERRVLVGYHWWTATDLRQSDDMVWPAGLVNLIIARDTPAAWPVSLSTAQESTVPVK